MRERGRHSHVAVHECLVRIAYVQYAIIIDTLLLLPHTHIAFVTSTTSCDEHIRCGAVLNYFYCVGQNYVQTLQVRSVFPQNILTVPAKRHCMIGFSRRFYNKSGLPLVGKFVELIAMDKFSHW
jgi:hypothetical protein